MRKTSNLVPELLVIGCAVSAGQKKPYSRFLIYVAFSKNIKD